jgi:hypothetical protein
MDVLSPSDGYFRASDAASESTWQSPPGNAAPPQSSNVPSVPNVWVADPSLEQESASAGKAREAAQERLALRSTTNDNTTTSSVSHGGNLPPSTPRSVRQASQGLASPTVTTSSASASRRFSSSYGARRGVFEEQTPLVPNEAPPAYTPSEPHSVTSPTLLTSPTSPTIPRSPTSPISASSVHSPRLPSIHSRSHSRNYSTFSDPEMGHDESQRLLAREPESMADERHRTEQESIIPAWQQPGRRAVIGWPRNCSMFIVGFVLLLTTAGLLASMVRTISRGVCKLNLPFMLETWANQRLLDGVADVE